MKAGLVFYLVLSCIESAVANEHAKRLFDELLSGYNKLRRPVANPSEILTIRLKLRLSQIIDVHEKDQIMTASVWLKQEWFDPKLKWKPTLYGNVTVLYVPASIIWTPDIVLYNNADSTYNITIATKATLHYSGLVKWEPPAVYKSMCPIEVEWFPFDVQTCHLKFGSWTYHEKLLDLQYLDPNLTYIKKMDSVTGELTDMVENGVDLSECYPSVEWDIISVPARRHGKHYPSCCPDSAAYIDITYYILLKRKPLFYTVNLIFPCVGISFLTIVVFYLPSDSGEKISLSISILVSLTVFFLLLTEIIPATSIVLPLIGKYLLFTMVMVTLSVLATVIVLNIHFRRPTTHEMPRWTRTPIDLRSEIIDSPISPRSPFCGHSGSPSGFSTTSLTTPLLKPPSRAARVLKPNLGKKQRKGMKSDNVINSMDNVYSHPSTLRAFSNLESIAEILKSRDDDTKNEEDWKFVATVLDRLFLFIFGIACFLGTVGILLQAPTLYDDSKPIDARNIRLNQQSNEITF